MAPGDRRNIDLLKSEALFLLMSTQCARVWGMGSMKYLYQAILCLSTCDVEWPRYHLVPSRSCACVLPCVCLCASSRVTVLLMGEHLYPAALKSVCLLPSSYL